MLLLTSFQTFFLCTGDYFGEKALKNIGNTATATCKAATSRLVCYMIHDPAFPRSDLAIKYMENSIAWD